MVAEGKWREVYDEHGKHIGFQICPSRADDHEKLSIRSSTGLVAHDVVLNAGAAFKGGRSKTAHLTDKQRDERVERIRKEHGKIVPHEDAVERVQAKIAEFQATRLH